MENPNHITKLNADVRVNFRQADIDRRIRAIEGKINEIIEAVNQMTEPIYADDFDDDELREMVKGNDPDAVFTPQEAKKILAERQKAALGREIIE